MVKLNFKKATPIQSSPPTGKTPEATPVPEKILPSEEEQKAKIVKKVDEEETSGPEAPAEEAPAEA